MGYINVIWYHLKWGITILIPYNNEWLHILYILEIKKLSRRNDLGLGDDFAILFLAKQAMICPNLKPAVLKPNNNNSNTRHSYCVHSVHVLGNSSK